MFGIFNANWYVAGCAVLVLVTTYVITIVWRGHKCRSNGRHAIERLRKLDRQEPMESELIIQPALSLHIDTTVQAVFEREELREPELAVRPRLPLPVGTKVQAVRNFGQVQKGAPGIITGVADLSFFWWSRAAYRCTFSDNMKVYARSKQIEACDHGYNLLELEQADFVSILSRQMMLRAQQLFSSQRAMRLGNTFVRGA